MVNVKFMFKLYKYTYKLYFFEKYFYHYIAATCCSNNIKAVLDIFLLNFKLKK